MARNENIPIATIIDVVAREFKVTKEQLRSKSRLKQIAAARHVAIYLCRRLTSASYTGIGRHFGGRDHSTVIVSCRVVAERVSPGVLDSIAERVIEEHRTRPPYLTIQDGGGVRVSSR